MRSAPTGEERILETYLYIAWIKLIVDLLVRPEHAGKAQLGEIRLGCGSDSEPMIDFSARLGVQAV
jgi:hypothetical protein